MFKVKFNGKIYKVYDVQRFDNGTIMFLTYDKERDPSWRYIVANRCEPYESEVDI